MNGIPVVETYPAQNGMFLGQVLFDKISNCLYVWGDSYWVTFNQINNVPDHSYTIQNLQSKVLELNNTLNYLGMLTDLFATQAIDSEKYTELRKLLRSGNNENIELAKSIIEQQHSKLL